MKKGIIHNECSSSPLLYKSVVSLSIVVIKVCKQNQCQLNRSFCIYLLSGIHERSGLVCDSNDKFYPRLGIYWVDH